MMNPTVLLTGGLGTSTLHLQSQDLLGLIWLRNCYFRDIL